ncbi:hypothetical protein ACSBR2_031968 [Camellia fascicularis]
MDVKPPAEPPEMIACSNRVLGVIKNNDNDDEEGERESSRSRVHNAEFAQILFFIVFFISDCEGRDRKEEKRREEKRGDLDRRVKMSEGQRFQLGTIGALSLSVVSSVSIVICNKALITTLGFSFATTLTSWHLLVTFCSLHVALWMKLFEHKPFDPRAVMGFGVLNGTSIGLLNLSLGFNSVGFYQMTKLAIIPCTVLLETIFFRKKFS